MPQFDLRNEPWIPCVTNDGRRLMSLVDVLTEAHEIRELVGDSPPVTIALHRLLLAILHRVYRGPQSSDDWKMMYSADRFDAELLNKYFNGLADRFDLFHSEHPFYQTTSVCDKLKDGAVIKLYFHSGNNATLFDHTSTSNPRVLTPAEAARLVVMIQAFDTGGQITGDNGADSAKSAPLIQSAVALVRGETLFETLMLNLHRYNGEDGAPFEFNGENDLPAWERNEPTTRSSRLPEGPVDLLTWQSRRVLLGPERDENGELIVRKSAALAGYSFPEGMEIHSKEAMVGYRKDRKGKISRVRFVENQSLWRNSHALFDHSEQQGFRPKTLNWLADLQRKQAVTKSYIAVDFLGINYDPKNTAKLVFSNHESFTLPAEFLINDEPSQQLHICLDFSEVVGKALQEGLTKLIAALIESAEEKRKRQSKPKPKRQPQAFPALENYWSRMEVRFHLLLGNLPEKGDEEMTAWFRDTQRIAFDAFNRTVMSLSGSAAENKAAVAAENAMRAAINKAIKAKATEWAIYLPERFEAKGGNQ